MNLTSASWSCARCGAAFIGAPPEHGLWASAWPIWTRLPGWPRSPAALPDVRWPGVRRLRQSPPHPPPRPTPAAWAGQAGQKKVTGDDG